MKVRTILNPKFISLSTVCSLLFLKCSLERGGGGKEDISVPCFLYPNPPQTPSPLGKRKHINLNRIHTVMMINYFTYSNKQFKNKKNINVISPFLFTWVATHQHAYVTLNCYEDISYLITKIKNYKYLTPKSEKLNLIFPKWSLFDLEDV